VDIGSYIDSLAAKGRYHFTTEEAVATLGCSPVAARAAIRRLREKGRVAMPFRGFHLIVPPEYRALGCLPADQFVPQLMQHLSLAYYAGLLSAASLHGAAHQAPMVFQVIVADNRPEICCGRVRVEFVARRNVTEIPTVPKNTLRGVLRVSTPEATAFDLVGYPSNAGGLSNVATILSELAENLLDARKLLAETGRSPLPWTQRLGYLLERVGAASLAASLAPHVAARAKEYVPLRPGKPIAHASRDSRWRLLVNEEVEADL
jgi:predicted transcriptional regulator of viral defense system